MIYVMSDIYGSCKIILGLTCKIQQYMVNYKKYFVLEWEEIVSVDEQQRIS